MHKLQAALIVLPLTICNLLGHGYWLSDGFLMASFSYFIEGILSLQRDASAFEHHHRIITCHASSKLKHSFKSFKLAVNPICAEAVPHSSTVPAHTAYVALLTSCFFNWAQPNSIVLLPWPTQVHPSCSLHVPYITPLWYCLLSTSRQIRSSKDALINFHSYQYC